jgi:hypothetical protein
MKKVLLGFMVTVLLGIGAKAQPVSDNAVIPMAITVNSILRLNVVDGGNIEFVFNTLNDIANGLSGDRYTTTITVASSSNWALSVMATTTDFFDDGGAPLALNNVCFYLTNNGATYSVGVAGSNTLYRPNAGGAVAVGNANYSDLTDDDTGVELLYSGSGNAGDPTENNITFHWECGTVSCAAGLGSIQGTPSGRYSTSILMSLRGL